MLCRRELAVKRDQNAACEENCIGGNQPLRLIRHDNRGARAALQAGILQRASEGQRGFLELADM